MLCFHRNKKNTKYFIEVQKSAVFCCDTTLCLSHNNLCFQCNIAITNFLVSHTWEITFDDFTIESTVHVYVLKHG